jgi:hypothetical protein
MTPEEKKEYMKNWRKNNPDKTKKYRNKYYLNNLEKSKNWNKNWNENNLIKVKELHKIHYNKNKKLYNEKSKNRYRTHKEEMKEYNKNYLQSEKGKLKSTAHVLKRHRELGFIPLNQIFEGSEFHHINKVDGIFIPSILHKKYRHRLKDPNSMIKINIIAWDFLESQSY